MRKWVVGIAAGVLVPAAILAADVTLPHVFSAGAPIRASEVNANFQALKAAIDAQARTVPSTSGTRLKQIAFASADGMKGLAGAEGFFYDSELELYCEIDTAETNVFRCLPDGASRLYNSSYYSDSACTVPLADASDPQQPLPGLPAVAKRYIHSDNTAVPQVFEAGPTYTGTVYAKSYTCGQQPCTTVCAATTPSGGPYVTRGAEVALTAFAEFTFTLY